MTYKEYNLFPDAGEDSEEGDVECERGDEQRKRRHISRDGRAVVVRIQGRPAFLAERVEPPLHRSPSLEQGNMEHFSTVALYETCVSVIFVVVCMICG